MICTKCEEDKLPEDFPFRNKEKQIRNKVCKVCQRDYKNAYYSNNKESHKVRNNKTRSKLRDILEEVKSKGCFMCPEKFKPCLEFHHLNGEDKLNSVGHLVTYGSQRLLLEEIDKCVLLCANCHRKVHFDDVYNKAMLNKLNTSLV